MVIQRFLGKLLVPSHKQTPGTTTEGGWSGEYGVSIQTASKTCCSLSHLTVLMEASTVAVATSIFRLGPSEELLNNLAFVRRLRGGEGHLYEDWQRLVRWFASELKRLSTGLKNWAEPWVHIDEGKPDEIVEVGLILVAYDSVSGELLGEAISGTA